MNILFVCHRLPYPPRRGGKIRPFNIIRHLGERHRVTVASLARSAAEANEGRGLENYCEEVLCATVRPATSMLRMLARVPTVEPLSMGYFRSPALARDIRRVLAERRFDLIFVHCSSVAQYVLSVAGIPKVLDFGDMDSQKWLAYVRHRRFPASVIYRLEGLKLERAERALASVFDLCTCTTRAELATLRGFGTPTATGWFPNGVDQDYFRPSAAPCVNDRICFIGRMDYFPNQQAMLEFCSQVLPRVRARRPAVELTIVGAEPPPAIRRLARIPGVTVTGSVADVRPHVLASALSVAPLRIARGTQNKILESMAMGVAVIASEQAAGGVDAVPGEHLLTATSDGEFADSVVALLEDPPRRARLAAAGRERMRTHHDWSRSMQRLDAMLAGCFGTSATGPRTAYRD